MSELIRCYGEPPNSATPIATLATPSLGEDATPATERLLAELVELTRHQGEELRRLREEMAQLRYLPAPSNETFKAEEDTPVATDETHVINDPHGFRAMAKEIFK